MDKLKAIVAGGYNRHSQKIKKRLQDFLEFVHVRTDEKFERDIMKEAQVVVLLTDYARGDTKNGAREISRKRSIPFIEVISENYVRAALEERQLISKSNGHKPKLQEQHKIPELSAPVAPPQPDSSVPSENAQKPEEKVGLTEDQLLAYYFDGLLEFVKAYYEVGQKIHQENYLEDLSDYTGLTEDVCQTFLPHIARKRVMVNTAGLTWKRMSPGEPYIPDPEEVPKAPPKKGTVMKGFAEMVAGLPEGPHQNCNQLVICMERYKEFRKPDGICYSRHYGELIAKKAEKLGLAEKRPDGTWFILHDPSVKLTLVEPEAPPAPKVEEKPKKEQTKKALKKAKKDAHKKQDSKPVVPELRKEEPKKKEEEVEIELQPPGLDNKSGRGWSNSISLTDMRPVSEINQNNSREVKKRLNLPQKTNATLGQIRRLRGLFPEAKWDQAARDNLTRRIRSSGLPAGTVVPKEFFSDDEWGILAWESIRPFPLTEIVKDVLEMAMFEDKMITCRDCMGRFAFTANDQEFYHKKFGEVIPPSTCPDCRRKRNDANRS